MSILPILQRWKQNAYEKGYLAASVDTLYKKDKDYIAEVYKGIRYVWQTLRIEKIESEAAIDTTYFTDLMHKPISIFQLEEKWNDLLQSLRDKGYPNAEMRFKDVKIDSTQIQAVIAIDLGRRIILDTLLNAQEKVISSHFLYSYLGFKNGEVYEEKKIMKYEKLLQQLPFLKLQGHPTIEGMVDFNKLKFNIVAQRANKFDFLLALQPSSSYQNKFEVTGEGLLQLKNTFKQGESMEVSFKKITKASNTFRLYLEDPFLPRLPIGAELKFDLQKRDSSFLDVNFLYGIRFSLGGNNYLKIKNILNSSRLLRVDTSSILSSKKLPRNLDYNSNTVGVEFNILSLNSTTNPTSGWHFNMLSQTGTRKIKVNSYIASLYKEGYAYKSLYDSIDLSSLQMILQSKTEKFFRTGKMTTLRLMYQNGFIWNKNILNNEKFRIGGYKILRGYDEESIFASWYQVATVEYRLLIGKNSNVFCFTDVGAYGRNTFKSGVWDYPISGGLGLNFETLGGIVSFTYALGRTEDQWKFDNSKIHFGYVTYF